MLSSKEVWANTKSKSIVFTSGNQAEPNEDKWLVPQELTSLDVLYVWREMIETVTVDRKLLEIAIPSIYRDPDGLPDLRAPVEVITPSRVRLEQIGRGTELLCGGKVLLVKVVVLASCCLRRGGVDVEAGLEGEHADEPAAGAVGDHLHGDEPVDEAV